MGRYSVGAARFETCAVLAGWWVFGAVAGCRSSGRQEAPPPQAQPRAADAPRDAGAAAALPAGDAAATAAGGVERLLPAEVTASSFVSRAAEIHAPSQAFDSNPMTAWTEDEAGPGVHSWLQARFGSPRRVRRIELATGWDAVSERRREDLFVANAHIRKLRVEFEGGASRTVDVDERTRSVVLSDLDQTTSTVRFVVEEAWPGHRYEDLCVSEVRIDGDACPTCPPPPPPEEDEGTRLAAGAAGVHITSTVSLGSDFRYIDGQTTAFATKRFVRTKLPDIRRCYDALFTKHPDPEESVSFAFRVNAAGQIAFDEYDHTQDLIGCVDQTLSGATVPGTNGPSHITMFMYFRHRTWGTALADAGAPD